MTSHETCQIHTEIGYQRAAFDPDTSTWEIGHRRLGDRTLVLCSESCSGTNSTWPDVKLGVGFLPAAKVSYDLTTQLSARIEYYAALADLATMDQVGSDALVDDRFTMQLYAGFAFIALLLAAVGIYGLMAFTVSQRTQEIGIRMALGAIRGNVARLIIRQGATLALIGLLLGAVGAILVGRAMQSTLYGVGALDLSVIAVVSAVLLLTALLASWLPARRVSSIEPMQALRIE